MEREIQHESLQELRDEIDEMFAKSDAVVHRIMQQIIDLSLNEESPHKAT